MPGHHVYIVTLKKSVLKNRSFSKANPGYVDGKPCAYVGKTGKDPELRYLEHMFGIRAGRQFVTKFGKNLRFGDMDRMALSNLSSWKAQMREVEVARELRAKGWGIWQN